MFGRLKAAAAVVSVTSVVLALSATSAPASEAGDWPVITSISPSSGSTEGGDEITLTGHGFTGAINVHQGVGSSGYDYGDFTVVSDSEIRLTTRASRGVATFSVQTASHPNEYVPSGSSYWFRPVLTDDPVRVLPRTTLQPGQPLCLPWESWSGVDPSVRQAGVLNVTTVAPRAPGNVVVYPDLGHGVPHASTVNLLPGADVANVTVVPLYRDVPICVAAAGSPVDVILDLVATPGTYDGHLSPNPPGRYLDTRSGSGIGDVHGPVPAFVRVPGSLGYGSAQTRTVLANVTVANGPGPGNLRILPAGGPTPATSTANYLPGADRATAAVLQLGADRRVELFSSTAASRGADVIVDVYGELSPYSFVAAEQRVVDTRTGAGAPRARLTAAAGGNVVRLPVDGLDLPPSAYGAILSVIAASPSAPGHVRVHSETAAGATAPPNTSTVNYVPGVDSSNLVWVDLWAGGDLAFSSFQDAGSTDLVVDVVGYLTTD